ncbi:hypothetical protein L7F22_047012 [Adiantum nelumboides]|nr:hypothetical protein [Adiantum nelumboides]
MAPIDKREVEEMIAKAVKQAKKEAGKALNAVVRKMAEKIKQMEERKQLEEQITGLKEKVNVLKGEWAASKDTKEEEGEIHDADKEAMKEEITKEITKAMEFKMEATKEGWVDVVRKTITKEVKEEKRHEETLWMHATLEEKKMREAPYAQCKGKWHQRGAWIITKKRRENICIRRWIDERDPEHLKNGAKYFSAVVAAGIALTYNHQKTTTWLAIFIVVSSLVAGYQLYWDLYKDWGLLRSDSKNYLLRDQLMLKQKNLYYASMFLNAILRFAWLQSITQIEFFGVNRQFTDWFFASLEVIRRVHWNFYRLENEHLNNVGNFRATKAIPLPFVDADDVED